MRHTMNPGALAATTGAQKSVFAGELDGSQEAVTGRRMQAAKPVEMDCYARQTAWRDRNPMKVWAHAATRSALRRGLITKPDRCEGCSKPGPLEAHHHDHRDPLRIAWLCRKCHKRLHGALRRGAAE
jgi:hypothetical protein